MSALFEMIFTAFFWIKREIQVAYSLAESRYVDISTFGDCGYCGIPWDDHSDEHCQECMCEICEEEIIAYLRAEDDEDE